MWLAYDLYVSASSALSSVQYASCGDLVTLFKVLCTSTFFCELDMQGCKLEGILVLRIQDGNDIFVSVAGRYLPSCYGIGLQCLSTLPRYAHD